MTKYELNIAEQLSNTCGTFPDTQLHQNQQVQQQEHSQDCHLLRITTYTPPQHHTGVGVAGVGGARHSNHLPQELIHKFIILL